ncbi:unnamed protein product [Spirodela intermedia]|uniref:NusG-like N-terminal domain-containing protein n=1 Tax=Spirodela intermedia TaxID=51605 RepID=A0A7I8IXG2_SPIIN|nr:unnamed protein product [Spirodela intermedia]CAA6661700.1 unnamed protein product [Spirodela intermedia]
MAAAAESSLRPLPLLRPDRRSGVEGRLPSNPNPRCGVGSARLVLVGVEGRRDGTAQLTARERRQMRNERRESLAAAGNWREEVEERLLHKPKKRDKASWKDELNLDNLALLGPQWWVVRVSRVTGQETAERLARVLARNYPDLDFKVYFPAVKVKRKLKSGSYAVKPKPLFPGCAFLHCVLNKELHDFVRECDGIGGFLGSKVGNTKRQINKPKPVAADEMEAIFHQTKREQELYDQSFEEDEADAAPAVVERKSNRGGSKPDAKPRSRSKKASEAAGTDSKSLTGKDSESLVPGSNVRVLCGPFMNYSGLLNKLDRKAGKATIGIMMFGNETLIEVEANEIVAEAR